ncbi:MAG: hypothetical protein EPO40_36440 [Myxococcaceae bacterium]|nr:MAG: hypothetical protein EPO40_36440 [Myxococcaceae bacterium]
MARSLGPSGRDDARAARTCTSCGGSDRPGSHRPDTPRAEVCSPRSDRRLPAYVGFLFDPAVFVRSWIGGLRAGLLLHDSDAAPRGGRGREERVMAPDGSRSPGRAARRALYTTAGSGNVSIARGGDSARSTAAAVEERPGMTSKAGWEQIGDAGAWKNTTVGVGSKGRLFTVESSGKLYATSARTGGWDEVGSGYNTQHLAIDGDHLYAIEADGTLYRVEAETGAWSQLGKKGDWKGTTAAVAIDGYLYTVSDNTLYETDLSDGSWEVLGEEGDEDDGWDTRFLFADDDTLYSLESDGSLYEIDGDDGSWTQIGNEGDWKGTRTLATLDGHLYSVEESGVLYKTNLSTGQWEEYGSADDFGATQLLFGTGKAVYSIEENGNLYKLDL